MNPELSPETMGKRESGTSTGTAGSHPVSQPVSATTSTPVEQPNYDAGQLLPFPIEETPSAHTRGSWRGRPGMRTIRSLVVKSPGNPKGAGKIKSTSSQKAATAMPDQHHEEPRSKRRAKKLDRTAAAEGNKGVPGGSSQPTAVSGDQEGSQGAAPLATAAQRTNTDGELSATKDTGMSGSSTCGTSAYPTPSPSAPPTASRDEQTAAFKVSHIPSNQVLKHYRGQQSGLGTLEAESSRPVMVPMNKYPDSETHQSKKVGVMIFFLGTVLIPLLAFTFLFLSSNKGSPPSSFPVCSSDGCLSLAAALSAKRNRSLDPCEDFGMYVCAAWKRKYSGLASTTMEQTILDSILNQSPPNMSDYIKDLPLRRRPEQFMALCDSARPTSDVPAIRALKEFMRAELSFLMPPDVQVLPSNTSVYAQLLKALVVLSGKWLVPLWFRIDMTGRSGKLHVGLSAEPLTELWHRVQNSFNQAHYQRYVELFIEVIYGNGSVSGGASQSYLRFLRSRSAYVQASAVLRTTFISSIILALLRSTYTM
ncbi:hypothetical protein HPB51_017812 [Rhipicephalus microplus]|uniref:Uncharacterized protein n=1 Tax=Rhipicephalus microplus TaxID=6941 RepID=A0A9J6DWJ9_RHIMP|nr:hypothetical protein HPB51_017812 [Rhipicephalus microplus]